MGVCVFMCKGYNSSLNVGKLFPVLNELLVLLPPVEGKQAISATVKARQSSENVEGRFQLFRLSLRASTL